MQIPRISIFILCVMSVTALRAQTSTDLNEGSVVTPSLTPDNYIFSWWGKPSHFYVIEHSADLLAPWSHIQAIEPGYGEVAEWGFATNTDTFFIRLKYTDDNLQSGFYGDDDFDGIINGVEVLLGYSALIANGNFDGDLLTDREEIALGLNPNIMDAVDLDLDGIVDAIERLYGLSTTGTTDLDSDSMDDEWELKYYLNIAVDDGALDPDQDGLTNLEEFTEGTNPWAFDTDGDTIPDGVEFANSLDPEIADSIHIRNNYAWQFTTDLTDRFSEFSDRISRSSTHSLALDKDGNVYAWGENTAGQLAQGVGTAGTDLTLPTLTQFNASRSVAAGDATSHVVNLTGTAQAAGNNFYGVLGDGTTPLASNPTIQETVVNVASLANVKRIYAQSTNVTEAIVGNSDELHAWGSLIESNYGGPNWTGAPQGPYKGLQSIAALSPSWDSGQGSQLGALQDSGEIYMWGRNHEHSLALSGSTLFTTGDSDTEEINEVPDASSIAVKQGHAAAMTDSGALWLWGKFNGLYSFAQNEQQSTPTEVSINGQILRGVAIANVDDSGQEFLQKPGFVLDSNGRLWRFYRVITKEYSVPGTSTTETGQLVVEQIPFKNTFVGITEAYDGIIMLSESGELFHYSSGTESYDYNQIVQLSNGSEFSSILTSVKPSQYGVFTKLNVPDFYDAVDTNNDGLNDLTARFFGLNPDSLDTNGDGVGDAVSRAVGIDPISWDNDGDTIPNAVEIAKGLNPNAADSDGDGMLDNEEFYLYDRLSNYILTTESDSQGPVINLVSPNATAL